LGLTTRHLLAWSWLRRAPAPVFHRFRHRAGPIADAIEKLADATWTRTHHGVERLGLVTYDRIRSEVLVGHPGQTLLSVEDATRGAAALPGLFPARRVLAGSRELRLCDGGVANLLPVDVLLEPPFRPEQVLVVDISNTPRTRERHIEKVFAARRERPDLPIVLAAPETIGRPTVVYRSSRLASLVEEGRRAVATALAQPAVAGAGVSPRPPVGA
jgi:predicted acylesterase/phospholipase RssA